MSSRYSMAKISLREGKSGENSRKAFMENALPQKRRPKFKEERALP
jgi:hypothetical protein